MTRCIACGRRIWWRFGRYGAFAWHAPVCPGEQLREERVASLYVRSGRLVFRRAP